ncbi:Est2 [Kluyveromyces lactis]|nr:Est2 [Kluyveromyces lactis]
MKILVEYLKSLECYETLRESGILINADSNGVSNLLLSCFVQVNSKHCVPPEIEISSTFSSSYHCETIETCILYLLHKNFTNNILTYGYQLGKNSDVTTKLFCRSSNISVSVLKGNSWRLFHQLVGTDNFVNLLINYSVYFNTGHYFRQIIGTPANAPQVPPAWLDRTYSRERNTKLTIDWNSALYHKIRPQDYKNIIETDQGLLIAEIFPKTSESSKTPRSLKFALNNLKPILYELIRAHQRFSYRHIINNICPKSDTFYSSPKSVIKLLVVCVRKTFPWDLLGSNSNYSVLSKAIAILVKKPLHSKILFDELCKGLRVKDVKWLETRRLPAGEQIQKIPHYDVKNRQALLYKLFFWILSCYVPKLLSTFFYVTELSSTVDIVYIRHDTWKTMSQPFLKSYFRRYLLENKYCFRHRSFTESKFNHRNLRLIPKKSGLDFRIIAVPCKGVNIQEFNEFNDYITNALKPTKIILERLRMRRNTKFTKAFSPLEIPKIVLSYKQRLLSKHGEMPNLYLLKFDIQSCYDSIPVQKVMKLVETQICEEQRFFIRSQDILATASTRLKRLHAVNGDIQFQENDLVIDSVKTAVLSKEDVLTVVKMELFKTSIFYRGKCYLRKDGLFQGTPLSSVLVDILYDDLLESYTEFADENDSDPMIIRLVDDFLIVSTSKKYIERLDNLAQTGFRSFNAYINPQKVLVTSSESETSTNVPFCALQLNLRTLEVWKDRSSYNVLGTVLGSSKQLYNKLLWIFEMRLSYNMLDERLNSWETAARFLREVALNVIHSFIVLFNRKKSSRRAFKQFVFNIFQRIDLNLSSTNMFSIEKSVASKELVLSVFLEQLKLRKNSFADILTNVNDLKLLIEF